ncbi:hypothetical protein QYE76_066016 [Lolium multiflorum]|uniref:CCHC-type domain-containing protein n=1 Tax=Lolium multiflorum TaxID=4521 RepID=A0AAD8W9B6_LOLMU|nr:hypothetical protein QYE76_066016 [Lolium multiflorum]
MMEIMPVDDADHIMAGHSINFNQFIEKEKLKSNGRNFTDWFRHVRIFLTGGNLQYVLDAPLGAPPAPAVSEEVKNAYETRRTQYSQVQCAILCSLEAELQKRFEHHDPCELVRELKAIFETHVAVESYEASKHFFGCMMEECSSVSEHVLAMSGNTKKLSDLWIMIPNQLGIHRVLQSLPPSYKNFVMNYNMQNMNKELHELFSMLKSAEVEIRKEQQVLMVNKTTSFKKQGKPKKGNFKKGGKKVAAPPEKPKASPNPDTVCYYCKEKGHWKSNCPKYLADLKSGLINKKGISDIHVIDVYLTGSRSSELRNKQSLARDEVTMRVGNGSKVDVIAVVPEDVPVQPAPIGEEANDNDHETSNEEATEPRRSTRERTTLDWYDPCLNVMIVDSNDEDPATYEEAMMSPNSNKWQEAMKFEMGSMYDNQVWTLVDLPDSCKAVKNKWIFKRKTDVDGNITVYKARLVAKGFRQIQGVDYDETFSPVAKLKSVRILLAIAAFFDYEIWQMDVKTAFLNGDIEEELYMVQPKGFVDPKMLTRFHVGAGITGVAPHYTPPPTTFMWPLTPTGLNFSSRNLLDSAAGGTFMSITLGAATKFLDDMMINYSEWHTERTPQGKKVNSVEETSSLGDKIDAIMSMLANGRSIDPNNVPLASLVAQEEHVDVNFIKNNNLNNNAYRNNYGNNNYRPYPSNNGSGYGNSYGNSYNNNKSVPSGLEVMLKEFISTQTAFNKTVEEKLGKIDFLASKVDSLALDVDLLKLKVMPDEAKDTKFAKTNAIQVRINDNIIMLAKLHARWYREEKEKLAKENNVAKVWTITTTSNVDSSHVAEPPTINGKIIGVGNVSTPSTKRAKLPETAETVCDNSAEIFQNAVDHNGLDFDDCHITEVIKFLQKLARSPNASATNLAFTKHITNALIKAREEKLKLEASIPRKLEDGWERIIKMKFNDFYCNALCDLGASISVMPKKVYDMLDLPPLKNGISIFVPSGR